MDAVRPASLGVISVTVVSVCDGSDHTVVGMRDYTVLLVCSVLTQCVCNCVFICVLKGCH